MAEDPQLVAAALAVDEKRGIRQNKIGGMPMTLLFALMSNIDAHGQYCREHPDFARWLVQHSLDTHDLETSFGMLVMSAVGSPHMKWQ